MDDAREAAETEILTEVLAEIAGRAGGVGGAIGGGVGGGIFGSLGGRRGGARGAERGARRAAARLKRDICELEFDLPEQVSRTLEAVERVLAEAGRPIDPPVAAAEGASRAALVGSGLQNRAVVTVEVSPTADGHSHVYIRGVAMEGLIKQRRGEKAAHQVRAALLG